MNTTPLTEAPAEEGRKVAIASEKTLQAEQEETRSRTLLNIGTSLHRA